MNNSIERVAPVGTSSVKRLSSPSWLARWRTAAAPSSGAADAHDHATFDGYAQTRERFRKKKGDRNSTRIVPSLPNDIDSMQLLRAQLGLRWFKDEAHRSLAIVTPDAQGPGPSIPVRLATACAVAGKRTLLIDANLRSPTVSSLLGVDLPVGLSSMLAGDVGLAQAITSTSVHGLSVLPSGPKAEQPEALLCKSTLKHVIDAAEREFDVVLFDTPPLIAFADALIVADVARGALVAVHRHRTRAIDLGFTGMELRSTGVTIVGAVFTDV
jgi:capsular exopolysaccharide synthesis family protein